MSGPTFKMSDAPPPRWVLGWRADLHWGPLGGLYTATMRELPECEGTGTTKADAR